MVKNPCGWRLLGQTGWTGTVEAPGGRRGQPGRRHEEASWHPIPHSLLVLRAWPGRGRPACIRPLRLTFAASASAFAMTSSRERPPRRFHGARAAAQALRDEESPRRVRHRAGAGQEDPVRLGLQPLQADQLTGQPAGGHRAGEGEHPSHRSDGSGKTSWRGPSRGSSRCRSP